MTGDRRAPVNREVASPEDRAAFLLKLRESGIRDLAVLRALEAVQRRDFLPLSFDAYANRDVALPIEAGRVCPSPFAAARIVTAASIHPGLHILEIGTGNGFLAALLAQLAGSVTTVERHRGLADAARRRFDQLGIRHITIVSGSAWPSEPERFDRIVVPAGLDELPDRIWRYAAPGGIVTYGRLDRSRPSHPTLMAARREGDGTLAEAELGPIRLPLERLDDLPVN